MRLVELTSLAGMLERYTSYREKSRGVSISFCFHLDKKQIKKIVLFGKKIIFIVKSINKKMDYKIT